MTQGLIALDIDGTVTSEEHSVPQKVIDYLKNLAAQGWQFAFVTGRTFAFASHVLRNVPFRYILAVNNGATIIQMPEKVSLLGRYLDPEIFSTMEVICEQEGTDFVVYGGFEHEDLCYYRPGRFSKAMLSYVQERAFANRENWQAVPSFISLNLKAFAAVKCFGEEEMIYRIAKKIEGGLGLHVPPIRDPYAPKYYIAQATHPTVNKGGAMIEIKKIMNLKGRVIAAGDDYNDHSMLMEADVRIVMATAPQDLLDIAHIRAPSALEQGIILGLKQAIQEL
jgi:hypothetical protein